MRVGNSLPYAACAVFLSQVRGRSGNWPLYLDSFRNGRIVWLENDGSNNFVSYWLSEIKGVSRIYTTDIDNDGDVVLVERGYVPDL